MSQGKEKDIIRTLVGKVNTKTALVADLQCSIARDCLQAERTLLLQCKFAATLGFVSLAVLLNYRFGDLVNQGTHTERPSGAKKFSIALAVIFFFLAMGSLVLGFYHYFNNIYHYVNEQTRTGSRIPTNIFLTLVVSSLLAVNIALLVDAYS